MADRSGRATNGVAPAAAKDAAQLWYWLVQHLGWSVTPALFRLRVFGRENLPLAGGALIASNHQSFLDPIFVAVGLRRPVSFMARSSLFRRRWFAALLRSVNAFPVERERADLPGIREALRRLEGGRLLLIFPEGTRSRGAALGRLRDGFGRIAARAGVPVVPAVVEGAHRAWPRGALFFEPRQVWVAFGRPLAPAGDTSEERALFSSTVRCRMEGLQRSLRRLRRSEDFGALSAAEAHGASAEIGGGRPA